MTYVTPVPVVSSWTQMTDEQGFIQARLMSSGVNLLLSHRLRRRRCEPGRRSFACVYSDGRESELALRRLILGDRARCPKDALYHELAARSDALRSRHRR